MTTPRGRAPVLRGAAGQIRASTPSRERISRRARGVQPHFIAGPGAGKAYVASPPSCASRGDHHRHHRGAGLRSAGAEVTGYPGRRTAYCTAEVPRRTVVGPHAQQRSARSVGTWQPAERRCRDHRHGRVQRRALFAPALASRIPRWTASASAHRQARARVNAAPLVLRNRTFSCCRLPGC